MPQFVQFTSPEGGPEYIDRNTVRAVTSSRHGITHAMVVIDGGIKVHVKGSPNEVFEALSLTGETPLTFWVAPLAVSAPASSTAAHVTEFGALMEQRLAANRHKGDRPGWLAQSFSEHLERAKKHLKELEEAFLHGRMERHDAERLLADCANRLMMARDRFLNPQD